MTFRRRACAAATALAAALALAGPGAAFAAACPKTTLADVEDEVMCPVCGTPLALNTEAPQAKRERAFIVDRIERCESKDEIKAALAAEFGDEVLATPEDEGFGLAAYVVPALALLGGAGAVAFALVRWRRRPRRRDGDGEAAAPGAQAGARLEADLRRYDL